MELNNVERVIMEKDVENYLANMVRFMRSAEAWVRVV